MSDNNGWIKIHRIMTNEWKWRKSPETGWLFLFILTQCNYKESKLGLLTIKPGQLLMSRRTLSEKTGISEQKCRTIIERLISTHEITHETVPTEGNNCTLITVNNWSKYQSEVTHELTSDQPTTNPRLTHEQPYPKNSKKVRKEEDTNSLSSQIIDHFNATTGHSYKKTAAQNIKFINARLNDGHTPEDLKLVIEHKYGEWKNDEKMFKYIRPETLFGSKFDSYLQLAKQQQKEDLECEDILGTLKEINPEEQSEANN